MQGWINTGTLNVMSKHGHNRLKKKCSNAAAILIKIECAVRNGYTAATSSQCSWNQVVQQKKVLHSCSAALILLTVFFYVAWASQDHRHWLFTAKSWLWSFVYTRKPLRTAWRTSTRGSLHWSWRLYFVSMQTMSTTFIQGMGITEEPYCDFICWTLVGIHWEQIKLDPALFRWMNAKLHCFFVSANFSWVLSDPEKEMHILMKLQDFIVTGTNKRYIANMMLCDSPRCK